MSFVKERTRELHVAIRMLEATAKMQVFIKVHATHIIFMAMAMAKEV